MDFSNTTSKIKSSKRLRVLIVFFTVILIVLMFPKGESFESDVTVGAIWLKDDLIAAETFPIYKELAVYEQEKKEAVKVAYPVFKKESDILSIVLDSLNKANKLFIAKLDNAIKNPKEKNTTFLSEDSYLIFKNIRKAEKGLSRGKAITTTKCFDFTKELLTEFYKKELLNINYEKIPKDSISVVEGKYEQVIPKLKFFDSKTSGEFIATYIKNNFKSNEKIKLALSEYINNFIIPSLIYSSKLTELSKKNIEETISPNKGIVKANERIIAKHESVTPQTKAKIDSYYKVRSESQSVVNLLIQDIGKFIHIVIILLIFSIYIFLFRKKIFNDNFKILLIAIIFLLICLIAFIVQRINVDAPIEYLIIVPSAAMLLTIMFDSRVGFYGTISIALICGALRGNDYVFSVTNIIAGALAAYTVRDIKNRNQIFRSFLFILMGYLMSILAFGFERYLGWMEMLQQTFYAGINALISPALTFGLIIFVEKAFKITTDLTYLELTDFNHPLLKELQKNTPGTFSHSMIIGSMVENAAEAIGANSILARVGSYYHDIGKLIHPELFVENQMEKVNIHEQLSPQKSAEMIIEHVTKGIELAKENNLPQDIIDFIPMHHGTLVIQFFYEKAKEEFGEENTDINDFRYLGPKPKSKETALVMLADACESAVRSMQYQDPQKIENMINNLIKYRIDDGQLDQSPLTFEDISKIKAAFLNILVSQHHKRIRYPKQEELENKSEEDIKKEEEKKYEEEMKEENRIEEENNNTKIEDNEEDKKES